MSVVIVKNPGPEGSGRKTFKNETQWVRMAQEVRIELQLFYKYPYEL
jgi:hypothetical protein